jgi:phage repressor protein C with HTH and peptisase S24 domain
MSFTHKQIWRGLDRLAEKHGLTASGLAVRAGLDATAFNMSKRIARNGRQRWPGTETLAKVLTATGESLENFVALMGGKKTKRGRK